MNPAREKPIEFIANPLKWDWSLPRFVPLYAGIHWAIQGALSTYVYNACLRHAEASTSVGHLYAKWELSIPFWPMMIVPYLSVYLLHAATFFVCRSARELMVLSLRLMAAVTVSGIFFVLWPLRNGFNRPVVEGTFAPLFRLLESADAPFNMAPSLHVTTTVILAATISTHTRGTVRAIILAWCATIVASTLLVWQHHLIDVISGLALGAACVKLIDFAGARAEDQAAQAPPTVLESTPA